MTTSSRAKRLAKIAMDEDSATYLLRRWAATWIDFIVLGLGFVALSVAGTALLPGRNGSEVLVVIIILAVCAYYVVLEGVWGRTLGKLVTGMTVIDERGRPPGIGRAIVRSVFRLIEVNPFLIGGLPAGIIVMMNQRKRRLGDMAAATYVLPVTLVDRFNRQDPEDLSVFD